MLITDPKKLEAYTAEHRLWQGIPGIEVTKKGRIFVTFYSGGITEQIGNFVLLYQSDDGIDFSKLAAVSYLEDHRCYDPCLWIDPLHRLWFIWSCAPEHAVYASICADPDAETLQWSEVMKIGTDVMMNKPTVLSTGEWLFPIAVWNEHNVTAGCPTTATDKRTFVYKTNNHGQSFLCLGGSDIPDRSFDEHMILERRDGSLAMYIRTIYGIGVSYSYDQGKTWTDGEDSKLGGPDSRFFIGRLKSGRVLLINHYKNYKRSHLTAMLSEDDGKTWPYKLLLDERTSVSYPDATEAEDGFIYVAYDRERGCALKDLDAVYQRAREILYAKITEADILAGQIVTPGSKLKQIASKLGHYAEEYNNPFHEICRFSEQELLDHLIDKPDADILASIFDHYQINCLNLHAIDNHKLDQLIDALKAQPENREEIIRDIIHMIYLVSDFSRESIPAVEKTKEILQMQLQEPLSIEELADKVNISKYYLCHLFKKETGLTMAEYKNALKLTKAKALLIQTNRKIADIAYTCGFSSASYFSKKFFESENLTPVQYRKLLKQTN